MEPFDRKLFIPEEILESLRYVCFTQEKKLVNKIKIKNK
jgi:hypothetical protein